MDNATKQAFDSVLDRLKEVHEDVKELREEVRDHSKDQVELKVEQSAIKTKLRIYASIGGTILAALTVAACKIIFFGA